LEPPRSVLLFELSHPFAVPVARDRDRLEPRLRVFALEADELPLRVAVLLQPVGIDQARRIVVRVAEDRGQECGFFAHPTGHTAAVGSLPIRSGPGQIRSSSGKVRSFCTLPVLRVEAGSNRRTWTSSSATGRCSTPRGTMRNSPASSQTERSRNS